jgi:hemerythrin-like domain-containing protein
MIRHHSLVTLSHDHHHGLIAAVRLKRGNPAYHASASVAESVEELWKRELEEHFEREERWLFPLASSERAREMVVRALDEHARMRSLVEEARRDDDVEAAARSLGELLESHIRFEERELFEVLQAEVGNEDLEEAARQMGHGSQRP